MADKGKLVVFSGFSGAGKGTIMKELMKSSDQIMHYQFLQLQEIQDRVKSMAGNISLSQQTNLKI